MKYHVFIHKYMSTIQANHLSHCLVTRCQDLLIESSNTRCEFTSEVQIIALSNPDKMVGCILLQMDG